MTFNHASAFILIYLFLTTLGLFTVKIIRRKQKKELKGVWKLSHCVCEFCQKSYDELSAKEITECPYCHLYNKNNNY